MPRGGRFLLWIGLALVLTGLALLYYGYEAAIGNVLNEIASWTG